MFRKLYPSEDIDSVYRYDFKKLADEGFAAVLFDVDNTLVPHGAPADKRAIDFFEHLRKLGFVTCLISNNKEPRVKQFADKVGSKYIFKAGKPSKSGYEKAMEILNTNKENTIFVGDQLFTDIWGANKAGIRSILVKPIHPKEEIQIILKRRLEWIVLLFYKRYKKKKEI